MLQWTHYGDMWPLPLIWSRKREVPVEYRHNAVRCMFLFCIGWIVRDDNGKTLSAKGDWFQTVDFYLKTPGHVLGPCDASSADGRLWAVEWRTAFSDWRLGK